MKYFTALCLVFGLYFSAVAQEDRKFFCSQCYDSIPEKVFEFKTLGTDNLAKGVLVKCFDECGDNLYFLTTENKWIRADILSAHLFVYPKGNGYCYIQIDKKPKRKNYLKYVYKTGKLVEPTEEEFKHDCSNNALKF